MATAKPFCGQHVTSKGRNVLPEVHVYTVLRVAMFGTLMELNI